MRTLPLLPAVLLLASCVSQRSSVQEVPLDAARLDLVGLTAATVRHRGREALELKVAEDSSKESGIAIAGGASFGDGTIEIDLAGEPRPGSEAAGARGFIGVAFRVQSRGEKYECFYLRPTNGRADDQFRRNHSTQYISVPDFPWERLRAETPGVYESYVDLVPGEWTKVRIRVEGTKARLFVGSSDQPCLIVNDLKFGESRGAIALWVGPGTLAHFASLKVGA